MRKTFARPGFFTRGHGVVAAEDVGFRLQRGEAVALVGESGSGKSTIARLIMRLESAEKGEILLDGVDVLARERRRASLAYRARVQMIFQDPFGSLNPAHTVGYHVTRPLLRHHRVNSATVHARAEALLSTVGLEPAADFIVRHPYELSGGQRQRVAIARALAVEPDLLIADEPTSMLDVSIRMGILNLLALLKRERGLAILLITHDLASARYLADRILVLFRGRVVEDGPSGEVVQAPAHPYTRALLASIAGAGETSVALPPPLTAARSTIAHDGAAPSATARGVTTAGCPFISRCGERMEICGTSDPSPRTVGNKRVRCHLYAPTAAVAGGGSA